jgi:hypothetical protein
MLRLVKRALTNTAGLCEACLVTEHQKQRNDQTGTQELEDNKARNRVKIGTQWIVEDAVLTGILLLYLEYFLIKILCLPVSYLSLWLYSPWRTLAASHMRFIELFRQMVGLPGRVISPSQGLYLHRTTQHRKTRTDIHVLSGIRTHDPSNQPTKTHASDRTATVTGILSKNKDFFTQTHNLTFCLYGCYIWSFTLRE